MILKTHDQIFSDEKSFYKLLEKPKPVQIALSPTYSNENLHLENFLRNLFSDSSMLLAEKKWREHEQSVIKYWTKKLENFNFSSSAANSIHAEHYIKEAGIQTLINLDLSYKSNWVKSRIENNELIDIGEFPSLQVMLYSQYYRIFDPYWKKRPQEVTDIQIISPSPYMDIVITEKFQAEILKKIRNRITGLNNSRIWTLKDIRN